MKTILTFIFAAVLSTSCVSYSAEAPVANSTLRQIFPDLMNARIMELNDLTNLGQESFKLYGFSFWLKGDFNRDGYEDVAIAGHFDNPSNPDYQSFITILTKSNGKWIKDYYLRPKSRTATLELKPHPDRKKNEQGFRSIVALFSELPSDDYAAIYWNGKSYQVVSGFDLTPRPRKVK
jgi:hypothetical protein